MSSDLYAELDDMAQRFLGSLDDTRVALGMGARGITKVQGCIDDLASGKTDCLAADLSEAIQLLEIAKSMILEHNRTPFPEVQRAFFAPYENLARELLDAIRTRDPSSSTHTAAS